MDRRDLLQEQEILEMFRHRDRRRTNPKRLQKRRYNHVYRPADGQPKLDTFRILYRLRLDLQLHPHLPSEHPIDAGRRSSLFYQIISEARKPQELSDGRPYRLSFILFDDAMRLRRRRCHPGETNEQGVRCRVRFLPVKSL